MRVGGVCWTLVVLAAWAGCKDESVLERSELQVTAVGWYRVAPLLIGPTGCLAEASTTSYSLDGATIPASGSCGALSGDQLEDRTFTIGVRDGDDGGQVVVTGLFPGLKASLLDPPDGRISPGGQIVIQVPVAAQPSTPYRVWFEYLDDDDPAYSGENAFISGPPAADTVSVTAPAHAGHFTLLVEMTPEAGQSAAGTILSCAGLRKCSVRAATDLGPLAVEVTSP